MNAVAADRGADVNVGTQGEYKAMTNKRTMTWALAGLLVLVTGATAWAADPNAANTEDGLTVRITPNADYGVTIDTANVGGAATGLIDLGAMDLYTSTYTLKPATVTITGTVSARAGNGGQELDVTARLLTASGWIFDPTPTTDATSGSVDELAMFLLMSPTTLSAAPSAANFVGAGAAAEVTSGAVGTQTSLGYRGGGLSGAGTKFEFGTDLDQMSVNDKKHLWMYFRLPSETSTGTAQDLAVTLTAVGSSL